MTSSSIANAALEALGSSVADTAAFALLVLLANALVRPSAATRHRLWGLVIALALVLPVASFSASLMRATPVPAVQTIAAVEARTPPVLSPHPSIAAAAPQRSVVEVRPQVDLTLEPSAVVATILALWLGIALAKNAGIVGQLAALRRVKERATPLEDAYVAPLRAWHANIRSGRRATLAVSRDVGTPCAAGLGAPAILIPEDVAAAVPADDLDRIAMHELAHIRRYDDWTNLVERFAAATLWFNPAIALAMRRIAIDREIACDDWVVDRTGGPRGYAACLFRLAEASLAAKTPSHALAVIGDPRTMTSRIEHLLAASHAPRRFGRTLPAALSIGAFAIVGFQAMRAPAIALEAAPAQPIAVANPGARRNSAERAIPKAALLAQPQAKRGGAKRYVVTATTVSTGPETAHEWNAVPYESSKPHALPSLPHLTKADVVKAVATVASAAPVQAVPNVPAVPKTPNVPEMRPLPPLPQTPDDRLDAATARMSAAAERVAERADGRGERLADEQEQRDAERDVREAEREIRDAAQREASQARSEGLREARLGREQTRAALEMVRETERIRKRAIEDALRSVREAMQRDGNEVAP